jgi:hypothetical protein
MSRPGYHQSTCEAQRQPAAAAVNFFDTCWLWEWVCRQPEVKWFQPLSLRFEASYAST